MTLTTQEKRARRKTGQPKRESLHFQGKFPQRFHLLLNFTSPTKEIRHPPTEETSFGMHPSQTKDKDGTLYNQITSGDFKTPLTTVTTVENSAIGKPVAQKECYPAN